MKKILSSILAAGFIASSLTSGISAAVMAVEEPTSEAVLYESKITEPTPEMMEQMIKKVRPLIIVPEEYTEFSWDYYGSNSIDPYWSFFWTDTESGEVSVRCDINGRIIRYDIYDYESKTTPALPDVSPEELVPVALDFMKKTAPYLEKMDLRLENTSYSSIFYNQSYTYTFARYENDIPVLDNFVTVTVSHITKEVTNMNVSMNLDVSFAKSGEFITKNKAKELLSKEQNMILSYRMKTEYDDDGNLTSRLAYLVYTPEKSYISVDAKTGEIYTARTSWTANKKYAASLGATNGALMDTMAKEESAAGDGGYKLTEQELEQLEVLESLITKDEATKLILEDKDLYIPDNAYLSDARLSKRYEAVPLGMKAEGGEKNEKYTWNLYFSTPGEMYLGMNASIDAHDGKLISFSSDLPYSRHYENLGVELPEIKFDDKKAQEIALGFITRHRPDEAKSIAFNSESDYSVIKYLTNDDGISIPLYRASRLNFVRQNEGLDFSYNNFRVGVDYATGKITSFNFTWYDDVVFESPKDVITPEKAFDSLYSSDSFDAYYEVNANHTYTEGEYNSVITEIYSRSVYSLYNAHTTTVRALDGKLVNYNNEEIVTEEFTGDYCDIQNHWAKDTIERFSRIGYGPVGNLFKPNDEMTLEDFTILCEYIRIYRDYSKKLEETSITRMDAVKYIVDGLGYGKVAKLENVFITDFADNSDFKKEDIGYAAIARGFGLIEGDGENFRPYDTLTRAEGLTMAENVIDLGILNY